jgi:hypothetical protein
MIATFQLNAGAVIYFSFGAKKKKKVAVVAFQFIRLIRTRRYSAVSVDRLIELFPF